MPTLFTQEIVSLIRKIPRGKVTTYGLLAGAAGNRRGARQVVRILHTCSKQEGLPWYRVVNREGRIALPRFHGYELQKSLLEAEGIQFSEDGRIEFDRFLWRP